MQRKALIGVVALVGFMLLVGIWFYLPSCKTHRTDRRWVTEIDYLNAVMYARGWGFSRRAALDDAYRHLLEELYFSNISSDFAHIESFTPTATGWKIQGWVRPEKIVASRTSNGWEVKIRVPI